MRRTQAVSSTTAGLAPSAPGAGFLTITFSDAPVERADVWAFEFDGSSRFPLFIGAHSRRSLEFIGGLELVGVIEDMGHWEAFMEPVLKIDVRKELGAARPGEGVRAWVIDLLIDAWAFVGRATFNG
ncbi:MAG: hypothetical protein M1829_000766 [Trizodia sp. TS-e1964]|nr:MAG: hypothetical protein M1829_000766 [Trizodia sp. TS-e1964]